MSAENKSTKRRKVGDAVLEALDAARDELDEREAKLEEREEALRKAVEGVEHEKKLMAGRRPSDVIPLNIGGTRCHVLRKTLCQYETSMLAAHFPGRWDNSIEKDADGFFFIDQPYELFIVLINFLRAKAIEAPSSRAEVPAEVKTSADFHRVVDYYGMTPFVYQQCFSLHRGQERTGEISSGPEPSIDSAAWTTFFLRANGHARILNSFEVVIGSVERPQIGWAEISVYKPQFSASEHKGVGEEEASVALDRDRGGIFHAGKCKPSTPNLALQAGTVVACEKTRHHFRWLIDGVEVAAVLRADTSLKNDRPELVPVISGKGQWKVTKFAY